MNFLLSLPGPSESIDCQWEGLTIQCVDGRWYIETHADEETIRGLVHFCSLQTVGELRWTHEVMDISLELLPSDDTDSPALTEDEFSSFLAELNDFDGDDTEPEPYDDLLEIEINLQLPVELTHTDWHLQFPHAHLGTGLFQDVLYLTLLVSRSELQQSDFNIKPAGADMDFLFVGDDVVGKVWKERDDHSPYNLLEGLSNTVAHPYLYRNPWPALDVPAETMQEIVFDTANLEMLEGLQEDFRDDYLGISEDEMSNLLRGLAYGLEHVFYDREDLWDDDGEDSDIAHAQHLMAVSLFAGSRIARAHFAKRGVDTSLQVALGDDAAQALVEGMITWRTALLATAEDERFSGVQSLKRSTGRQANILLEELLADWEWDQTYCEPLWGWMTWAFDLGVRYQTARLDDDGLQHWAQTLPY